MNSSGELHAEIPVEGSISTENKRKAPRDSDASKKQASPKRRHKEFQSPSSADIIALNKDEHLNGPAPLSPSSSNSDNSTKDDAISKVSRSTPKKFGGKAIETNAPLAMAKNSSNLQGDDPLIKRSASTSDNESEDEAPETVSVAAGLLQSRQAAADVAKADEMKKAATKSKRREHDARLKMQAKSAKERLLTDKVPTKPAPGAETASRATIAGTHHASEPTKWSIGDPLPELLPDEILAAVPEIPSAPVPSNLQNLKAPIKSKLKIFQNMSNPRKRFKRGSTVFQVLEDDGGILPPKVAKRSMSLRESWLRGRCGPRGEETIRRKKVGGGFVRK